MNKIIDLIKEHRSIRKFTEQEIPDNTVSELILAGQSAATSSFIQACTVIQVKDTRNRELIAAMAGNQSYVSSAPVFLVFCADFHRLSLCSKKHKQDMLSGFTEQLITATVDTSLFAQNTVIAAESLGLGSVYIGGIRNDPHAVSKLLELPENVYPVFGLCLGYPDQNPEIKPRLPLELIFKQEKYSSVKDNQLINDYDEVTLKYYKTRNENNKIEPWSKQMSAMLSKESRPHMKNFLEQQGFKCN
ncbi:oxygen-insensitive NADPH nitroreductase [Amphritea sp. HPY]|uniref:oxygen-insensitive NADPH nitroreductase n=1 Tax=Amphritea sp. HPY TaxID=3421652 RepID=UPI003D7D057E